MQTLHIGHYTVLSLTTRIQFGTLLSLVITLRLTLCDTDRLCGTVYGDMHYKDLMGSIVRVWYYIPVPNFYLVLHCHGLINQSINQPKSNNLHDIESIHSVIDMIVWSEGRLDIAVNTRTVLSIVPPQGCESILIEILQPT